MLNESTPQKIYANEIRKIDFSENNNFTSELVFNLIACLDFSCKKMLFLLQF